MDGLNVAYGVKIEGGEQRYPVLQATNYQPRTISEEVKLCLSEESFELLSEQSKIALNPAWSTANFGGDDVAIAIPHSDLRFIMLGKPRVMCLDKESGDVAPLTKGLRLAGTKKVTATKLLMAAVIGDVILESEDGSPQLFTLKLTSNKTSLVDGDRENKDSRSLQSLNNGLLKHYKLRGMWLGHLVSVQLGVKSEKFVSKGSGQSSIGIRFDFVGGARPLPDNAQQRMGLLAASEEVQEFLRNPFARGDRDQDLESSPARSPAPIDDEFISPAEKLYNDLQGAIATAPDTDFLKELERWWNTNSAMLGNWKPMGDKLLADALRRFYARRCVG